MNIRYSVIVLLLIINIRAESNGIPRFFDLTIKETYGCIANNRTYINFHFENDVFTIQRASDNTNYKIEHFNSEKFELFYKKFSNFDIGQMDSAYACEYPSTASGFGLLKIRIDNYKQIIRYVTQPSDETDFEYMHQWLSDFSKGITDSISFQDLINSKFYLNNFISDRTIQKSVEVNAEQLKIDDFLITIDTTKNNSLKRTMTKCLQYFQDNRILNYCGALLIENIDYIESKDEPWYQTDNSILFKSLVAQNKCDDKSDYLTKLLSSKNKKLRLECAIALAIDNDSVGVDIILDEINDCLRSSEYCVKWDEFSSLTNLSKPFVLPKLISNYKIYSSNEKYLLSSSWMIRGYIVIINNFLEDCRFLSPEDFRLSSLGMDLEKEITKLNRKLK